MSTLGTAAGKRRGAKVQVTAAPVPIDTNRGAVTVHEGGSEWSIVQ